MRLIHAFATAATLALVVLAGSYVLAQGDPDRVVPNGGISVPGWTGKIDAQSIEQGRTIHDAKLSQEGPALHIETGPAGSWWNPANKATGDYIVKATFKEPKFMAHNSHPHSYGIFIGGNDMGTDKQTMVYCVTYGNGRALIRGFGPEVFTLLRPTAYESVHKATAVGDPVSEDIQWTVKGGRAECSVNGTVIAGYNKSDLVTAGKLSSTDGIYGIRATHNVEAIVTGLTMTKN